MQKTNKESGLSYRLGRMVRTVLPQAVQPLEQRLLTLQSDINNFGDFINQPVTRRTVGTGIVVASLVLGCNQEQKPKQLDTIHAHEINDKNIETIEGRPIGLKDIYKVDSNKILVDIKEEMLGKITIANFQNRADDSDGGIGTFESKSSMLEINLTPEDTLKLFNIKPQSSELLDFALTDFVASIIGHKEESLDVIHVGVIDKVFLTNKSTFERKKK